MKALRILTLLVALTGTAACGGGDSADTGAEPGTSTATTETPAPSPATGAEPAAPAPATTGTVHEVHMVTTQNGASGVFQPANLTVKKGDVIRFINDGGAAHNANFQTVPENAGKPNLPPATPYLTTSGETAEMTIGMDPGTYKYQCDPHVATGMVGEVTVQ